jgi:hypothetical protein
MRGPGHEQTAMPVAPPGGGNRPEGVPPYQDTSPDSGPTGSVPTGSVPTGSGADGPLEAAARRSGPDATALPAPEGSAGQGAAGPAVPAAAAAGRPLGRGLQAMRGFAARRPAALLAAAALAGALGTGKARRHPLAVGTAAFMLGWLANRLLSGD